MPLLAESAFVTTIRLEDLAVFSNGLSRSKGFGFVRGGLCRYYVVRGKGLSEKFVLYVV